MINAALRRPITVIVAVFALVLGGVSALFRMPADVFPTLGIPTIYVAQTYGGMDPAQMEGYLTYYYEYHFLYITGIEHVESKSIQGISLMKLQFHPGTDMAAAEAEVIAYVNRARAFMPPGTVSPFVMRFDAGSVPVGTLVFSSEKRTVGEIQDLALNRVRPLFATLPGVSAPPPFGGNQRTIVVHVSPERLRAYNMTPDDVVAALANANVISPSGNLRIDDLMPMVPTNGTVSDIHDLDTVPLRVMGTDRTVLLRDVARVEDSTDIPTGYALVNGRRTVYIPVTKRADASTLAVVSRVKAAMDTFQAVLPSDIKVSYEFDQSPYVTTAIYGLVLEAVLGALLTGVMVGLFLRDVRSAFVVVVNIPLALLGSVVALWLCGQTINLMTLGGLALAVGVLVDEATVTIENIHTHLQAGRPLARAVLDASREIAFPLLVSMLTVLAVFLPSFLMTGVARAMFVPLSLAVGFSMVASYVLSRLFVPVISVWLLRGHTPAAAPAEFHATYRGGLAHLLRMRIPLVIGYLAVCGALVWLLLPRLGREIFPASGAAEFALRLRARSGTRIEKTEALTRQTITSIEKEAPIAISVAFIGTQAPSYPINTIYLWTRGPDEAVLSVHLDPSFHGSVNDLEERLRRRLADELPEVTYSFEPSDIVSRVMSLGASTPIEVAVSGPDLDTTRAFADNVRGALEKIPAVRDLQYAQSWDYPTVRVDVDRERAGMMGVTAADVARATLVATSSSRFVVPNYWRDARSGIAYQVQVEIPPEKMNSMQQVADIPVRSSADPDRQTLLRNVASVRRGTTPGEYDRYNMQRTATLTANIAGADLGHVADAVARAIASLGPPPSGVKVAVRGQIASLELVLSELRTGLLVSIVVVFLLLAANFQSIRLAVVAVAAVPAVITGVVLMLAMTGGTLNLQSYMGAIMAVGVAMANAVLLVTFAERSRVMGGDVSQAALDGAASRLRPILMTTFAMIAGMVPIALALGEGGQQTAPLGRAVIGGVLAGTAATLFVLPSVFTVLQRRQVSSASLDPDDALSAYYDGGTP